MEVRGKAGEEGELWSVRARDWAEVQERFLDPCYLEILNHAQVGTGNKVLDIGCGAGRFLQLAAKWQARVTGLDAAPGLLQVARSRTAGGAFYLGDMENLPFEDDSFDLVTGFNSFSHAEDPLRALSEAGRVARTGKPVAITVWGPSKPGSMRAAVTEIIRSLLGEGPVDSRGGEHVHSITAEEDLADLIRAAGLDPGDAGEVECPFFYPDEKTLLRGMMSPAPFVEVSRKIGEDRVREAILGGMAQFKTESGGYFYSNKFRYLIARAPGPGARGATLPA